MKIAYVAESVIPSESANSIHVMKMCNALAAAGHDVTLIVPSGRRQALPEISDIHAFYDVQPFFQIIRVAWPNIRNTARWWSAEIIESIASLEPDVVYSRSLFSSHALSRAGYHVVFEAHEMIPASGACAALGISRFSGALRAAATLCREWLKYRGSNAHDFNKLWKTWWQVSTLGGFSDQSVIFSDLVRSKRLLKLVTITQALGQDLLTAFPLLAKRVIIAPDGADLLTAKTNKSRHARQTNFVAGYCGHLYPGKGMELIEKLATTCGDISFHIVGGKPADLRKWRDRMAPYTNVVFYGHVPHAKTQSYIGDFDVCLLPNQERVHTFARSGPNIGAHTSPLKMFEYMSAGKPILASDLSVLREILVHEENALLSPPDNPDAWMKALYRLRDDHALRLRLGRNAKRALEQTLTWRARADRIVAETFNVCSTDA